MITYPNQKVVHINKSECTSNFLQVLIAEWAEASKALSPSAFKIYLYLAGNQNGFDLALSRKAVTDLLCISADSYLRGVKELQDRAYITHKQGNIYDFHTSPVYAEMHTSDSSDEDMCAETHTAYTQGFMHDVCADSGIVYADERTEIDITNNTDKDKYKEADASDVASLHPDASLMKKSYRELQEEKRKKELAAMLEEDGSLLEKLSAYSGFSVEEVVDSVSSFDMGCKFDTCDLSNFIYFEGEGGDRDYFEAMSDKANFDSYWEFFRNGFRYYLCFEKQ